MKKRMKTEKRKWSVGTVLMLVMLAAVLGGSALVIGRLSSGARVDLSRLSVGLLDIQDKPGGESGGGDEEEPQPANPVQKKTDAAVVSEPRTTAEPEGTASYTLTVGGSFSLAGEVRKNSRGTDTGEPDYSDMMVLLKPFISSDAGIVFLENIVSDRYKVSDTVAPASAAALLREAGFGMAACGFSQAYANGAEGVGDTITALSLNGISPLGIRTREETGPTELKTVKGIRTAFLQYTSTVPAKTRRNMEKDGTAGMVPEAEISLIASEIESARKAGAEAVIVLVQWGKTGKNVDKAQRELAGEIALAGADLIVGCGSRVPQSAEYLAGKDGGSVLCVWDPGTLLSGDRSNIRRTSGYLLHVTVRRDAEGRTEILNPEYTPVYTWKYKQDSRYYYRCVATGGEGPDGMDNEQRKAMQKSAEAVEGILKESPLACRRTGDAD